MENILRDIIFEKRKTFAAMNELELKIMGKQKLTRKKYYGSETRNKYT